MLIEQNTNYAYKLKYIEHPTFEKIRDLAIKFMRELPKLLQDELYEALNRGLDILESEPQMVTYLYTFGPMHQAKLNYAFDKLPEKIPQFPEINIIDYGCGQALGTMCYADFLRKKSYSQKIKTITLIEPSEMCLKRASLHASIFFPSTIIKSINKKFDHLTQEDIICDEETPTLHILSNVLDILDFDINKFSKLLESCLKGYNYFVCVGPYFNDKKRDERMGYFSSHLFCDTLSGAVFDKFEFVPDKAWTAQIRHFWAGKAYTTFLNLNRNDYFIKDEQIHIPVEAVSNMTSTVLNDGSIERHLQIPSYKGQSSILVDNSVPHFSKPGESITSSKLKQIVDGDIIITSWKITEAGRKYLAVYPHSFNKIITAMFEVKDSALADYSRANAATQVLDEEFV